MTVLSQIRFRYFIRDCINCHAYSNVHMMSQIENQKSLDFFEGFNKKIEQVMGNRTPRI